MLRRQSPRRGDVRGAAARFGDDVPAGEETELDADAGKPDALSLALRAGGDVVIPRQFPAQHAAPVVHDGERGLTGIDGERDLRRSGIQRVGGDFREDGFLDRPRVGVAQILEEVEKVDARLTHAR